jgi:uncharacterized protein YaaN involved in tellurite resistance
MNEMRGLFEDLDPGKQGDLMSSNKILGMIPFGSRLQAYLRRFDSASGSIRTLIDNIYAVQDQLARDDQELFATMNKLLEAMTRLKAVDLFIERMDEMLSSTVAKLKPTDPIRAKAIEQEVLFYARQASMDVKTQMLVSINGYKMLEGLRKTGRELHNGCDRMATIGMSSLTIAVTLARAQGYQMKVMDALKQGSAAIEGLIASTSKMFGEHVDRAGAQTIVRYGVHRARQNGRIPFEEYRNHGTEHRNAQRAAGGRRGAHEARGDRDQGDLRIRLGRSFGPRESLI